MFAVMNTYVTTAVARLGDACISIYTFAASLIGK